MLRSLERKQSAFSGKVCQTVFENVFVHKPLMVSAKGIVLNYIIIQFDNNVIIDRENNLYIL